MTFSVYRKTTSGREFSFSELRISWVQIFSFYFMISFSFWLYSSFNSKKNICFFCFFYPSNSLYFNFFFSLSLTHTLSLSLSLSLLHTLSLFLSLSLTLTLSLYLSPSLWFRLQQNRSLNLTGDRILVSFRKFFPFREVIIRHLALLFLVIVHQSAIDAFGSTKLFHWSVWPLWLLRNERAYHSWSYSFDDKFRDTFMPATWLFWWQPIQERCFLSFVGLQSLGTLCSTLRCRRSQPFQTL